MICPTGIAKYFCEKDWTTQIRLNRLAKSIFARNRVFARLKQAGRHSSNTNAADLPVGQISRPKIS